MDRREHRRDALKILIPASAGDPAFLDRLEHEAQTAAALAHPNIAVIGLHRR